MAIVEKAIDLIKGFFNFKLPCYFWGKMWPVNLHQANNQLKNKKFAESELPQYDLKLPKNPVLQIQWK